MELIIGIVIGVALWTISTMFYVIQPDQRAVKSIFGKAVRMTNHVDMGLKDAEAKWYWYPNLKVIQPGLHIKMPWEKIHKVNVSTQVMNIAHDIEVPTANNNGQAIDAIGRDQMDLDIKGQIRYRVSERNIYPFIFGLKNPVVYIMGYFSAILREKVATFEPPAQQTVDTAEGTEKLHEAGTVSINDLRKNLTLLNLIMDEEFKPSEARYGIVMETSLITEIIPQTNDVESALAAINTAHNTVASDISVAKAQADEKVVGAGRAIEIATLDAEAETEGIKKLYAELTLLKAKGPQALKSYVRNVRLAELDLARVIYKCSGKEVK